MDADKKLIAQIAREEDPASYDLIQKILSETEERPYPIQQPKAWATDPDPASLALIQSLLNEEDYPYPRPTPKKRTQPSKKRRNAENELWELQENLVKLTSRHELTNHGEDEELHKAISLSMTEEYRQPDSAPLEVENWSYEQLCELQNVKNPAHNKDSLPTHIYQAENPEPQSECVICMGAFEEGDNLRTVPCFHRFHKECIDDWLELNNKCPICQTKVD